MKKEYLKWKKDVNYIKCKKNVNYIKRKKNVNWHTFQQISNFSNNS